MITSNDICIRKINKKTVYSATTISMYSFLFGFNLCVLNSFKSIFVSEKNNFTLSEVQWTNVISIICIGALLSNILVSLINLNRKNLLIINGIINIVGQSIIRFAVNYYFILIGRFIIGIGAGITTAIVPLYLIRLAPENKRAIFGSLHQLSTVIGIFFAQLFSFHYNKEENWKIGMNIIICFVILQTFLTFFVKKINEPSSNTNKGVITLLLNRDARRSVLTSVFILAGQQLSGIRAVIFYSSKIFKNKKNPELCTGFVGICLILGTFVSMFIVDRFGRKKLLIFSILIAAVNLILLAFDMLTFLAIFGFIVGYSLGLGPIPWFITGEIFPDEYRKAGSIIGVSSNWLTNYITAFLFPGWLDKSPKLGFLPFFGSLMALVLFLGISFRETRNRKPDFL